MSEKKFATGLFIGDKGKSPDWILMKLSIRTKDFIEFLNQNTNDKGYVNVDILESKDGNKKYGVLNEWQPTKQEEERKPPVVDKSPVKFENDSLQDLPF